MPSLVKITGVSRVIKNMQKASKRYEKRLAFGLKIAGLFLQRESQKIVPVDKGNLNNTAFTRKIGTGFHTDVIVGYTASYAVYVHEVQEAAHGAIFNIKHAKRLAKAKTAKQKAKYARRGNKQQWKFLEAPARINRDKILRIIWRTAAS